jgi:mannose-6-phosphate isomerase-like protein (cupin superfamily)
MDLLRDVAATVPAGPAKNGLRKGNLFETARFFCDVYVVDPGGAQAAHVHDASDKVYLVLAGRGVVAVGPHRHEVRAGHAVHCPAGASHGVENPGSEPLRLLVFMAPHPKPPR